MLGGGATRPLPRDGGVKELPRRPNSRATPQGMDQRSKMEEVVPKMARRRGSDAGQLGTNVSPPQRGGAVPAPLSERWAEMARQLPRGARPSGSPQSSSAHHSAKHSS